MLTFLIGLLDLFNRGAYVKIIVNFNYLYEGVYT